MCFECRVLGAILGKDNEEGCVLEVASVRGLDFCPTVAELEDKDLRDVVAEVYLEDTLLELGTKFGVELVPVQVDSDGSCLPHALSRCLVGKEVLFDALRVALVGELLDNADFYKSVFEQGMDAETYEKYWSSLVSEAKPTRGAPTGRWLGPEHILGFCNLLKRPILLLDTLEEMRKNDQRCGLFLPLRFLDEPESWSGDPLVIGWASSAKNHFVCLVKPSLTLETRVIDRAVRASPDIWETIETMFHAKQGQAGAGTAEIIVVPPGKKTGDVCMLRDPKSGEEYAVQVPQGKGPGDSFEWTPPNKKEKVLNDLKCALVMFYVQNPPAVRQGSCSVMFKALNNLVDALLLADLDRIEKFSRLPLDNKTVCKNITSVPGALDVLDAVQFKKVQVEGRPYVCFQGDVTNMAMADGLVAARDALALLEHDKGVPYGGGQIPREKQHDAFGPAPSFLPEWPDLPQLKTWKFAEKGDNARREFAKTMTATISNLKQRYLQITHDTEFASMPWDDEQLYNLFLKQLVCTKCGHQQQPRETCEKCQELLDMGQNGQARTTAFIANYCNTSYCSTKSC